jgi:hypothetical protein
MRKAYENMNGDVIGKPTDYSDTEVSMGWFEGKPTGNHGI